MNIAIVGAGAVGGFLGILLQQTGHHVTFIGRGLHLAAMKDKNFRLRKDDEILSADRHFSSEYNSIESADIILFTVKGTDTEETINNIKRYVTERACIVSLQNGVCNEDLLIEAFGKEKVFPAVANISVHVTEPGFIEQHGPHSFLLGNVSPTHLAKAEIFIKACRNSGINMKYHENIMQKKWEKSLWNITFNPVSAISRASVSEMVGDPLLKKTCKDLLAEAVNISEKAGYPMSEKAITGVFNSAEKIGNHKTSMLQDLEKGKRMEVYSLCGYFVEQANRYNVQTPVLKTVYHFLQHLNNKLK
ncbi:ketopantoate reductase family protein [Halalkalibacter urbisdiaboli]|uniref:ketopantoate reductase family protein n=1 Tax=Halalkalibacter urbisdiaboli TaxID=1960589 RepID=UPI000B443F23|nr:ketopantoate reductase family protein [Halalkalibacter urbisdiaboli]